MPKVKKKSTTNKTTVANVGYEAQLWQMADRLPGSMDAAEYKHVALGLIFLKYISDAFQEYHAKLEAERAQLRVPVKRILRKYGYPPDKQEKAIQSVLQQAELLSEEWAMVASVNGVDDL